jgi:glyoxylase-like metal-dependent hydrolase (beta-lactamase superfamily II)
MNLLIAGDQILPTITPHIGVWPDEPEGNPLQGFLDTLPKFLELPDDTLVLPSHGLPFRGLHARVHSLMLHHRQRLDQAEAALSEWQTAAELMPALFKPARDTQDLALGLTETLAHLHQLQGDDRVLLECDAAGVRRFRRAA